MKIQFLLLVEYHPVDKLVDPALLRLDFVLDIFQQALVLFSGGVFRSNLVGSENHDERINLNRINWCAKWLVHQF